MIIIGIAGGTGSGKTTVVRKIIESLPLGSVAVIPQDSYYNDQSSIPLEIRKQKTFRHSQRIFVFCHRHDVERQFAKYLLQKQKHLHQVT